MSINWAVGWVRGVEVAGLGWLVIGVLLLWMLVIEPLYGRRSFNNMLRAIDAGDPGARLDCYRSWSAQGWLLMAVMLGLVIVGLGWSPVQLGLRMPALSLRMGGDLVILMLGAALSGMLLGVLAGVHRNKSTTAATPPAMNSAVARLLPRTGRERYGFALLSVTAGITEEVVYRGILLALLVAIFPYAPAWLLLAPMALMFGWAHWYQGVSGVLVTTILGVVLGGLYIGTGSLLIPIILHALVDLRAMLIPMPPDASTAGGGANPGPRCR